VEKLSDAEVEEACEERKLVLRADGVAEKRNLLSEWLHLSVRSETPVTYMPFKAIQSQVL